MSLFIIACMPVSAVNDHLTSRSYYGMKSDNPFERKSIFTTELRINNNAQPVRGLIHAILPFNANMTHDMCLLVGRVAFGNVEGLPFRYIIDAMYYVPMSRSSVHASYFAVIVAAGFCASLPQTTSYRHYDLHALNPEFYDIESRMITLR